MMYDIAKRQSFDALDMWIREASKHGGENLPVFVVGNKKDLDSKRAIPRQEVERWTKQRQFNGYFETSAREGNGFLNLFGAIAEII